ncbi:MAG TPA: MarC family protein [Bacillota bacterium]|nr:MarC family protein [Bacillota bacterium]
MQTLPLAITLFFVLDPFGNLPVVLGLLAHVEPKRHLQIVIRELIISLLLLTVFYAVGPWFLNILQIGPSDLKICGGVVLAIIALRLVFPDERLTSAKEDHSEPFIVPMAIPLIVGPSALATVMIMAAQSAAHPLVGLTMMGLAWFGTSALLLVGVLMGTLIPAKLLVALERLSGLLLAVIAVHMVMTGVQSYLFK